MAQLASRSQDRAVAFAAATLLCELLTQRLLTRQTELLSEGLAWVLLPALVRAARRRAQDEIAPLAAASTAATSRRGVAGAVLFAAGIAAASFCRAENGSCRFYVRYSRLKTGDLLILTIYSRRWFPFFWRRNGICGWTGRRRHEAAPARHRPF